MSGNRNMCVLLLCGLLTINLFATRTSASQRCAVMDLGFEAGDLDVTVNLVYAINNATQIVGGGHAAGTGDFRAFLWENGAVMDLGVLSQPEIPSWSEALGINDLGVVVGGSKTQSGRNHAFVWTNGQMRDLGTGSDEPGGWSFAYGVNEAGQIVGSSSLVTGATLWDDGSVQPLMTSGLWSSAIAISASGDVAGNYTVVDNGETVVRAFRWRDGAITDLGTLGGAFSEAVAINNDGRIVGNAATGDVDAKGIAISHAFIWQDGIMQEVAVAADARSSAEDINNTGQVVGRAYSSSDSRSFAFVYDEDHGVEDLNNLAPAEFAWHLNEAVAINDRGQIVALGRCSPRSRYFLLTPVVEGEDAAALSEFPECVPEEWPSTIVTDGAPGDDDVQTDGQTGEGLTSGNGAEPTLADRMRLCGVDAHLVGIALVVCLAVVQGTRRWHRHS